MVQELDEADDQDSPQGYRDAVRQEATGRILATFLRGRMSRETQLVGLVSTIVAMLVAILSVVLPPIQPDQLRALPIILIVLLMIAVITYFLFVPRGREFQPSGGDKPSL